MGRDSVSQALPDFNQRLSISSPPVIMVGQITVPLVMPPGFTGPTGAEDVPVENLEMILSNLPARKVAQFRLACKNWEAITSTSHFINMHTKNRTENFLSAILIEKNHTASLYSLIQSEGNSASSSSLTAAGIMGSYGQKTVAFSGLGFIVLCNKNFKSPSCEILNPVTREKVKLLVKEEDNYLKGKIYAIYLDPKLQEVCVLWGQRDRLSPATTEFKLLNLKSAIKTGNSCWRNVVPRLHRHIPRNRSNRVVPPVILNNALYWMIGTEQGEISCEDAILAFDTEREEFKKLSHPGPYCTDVDEDELWKIHKNMNLLQTNGEHLSLCEFSEADGFINTWEMRSGKWIRKHRVQSNGLLQSWPDFYDRWYSVVGMVNREAVLLAKCGTGKIYLVNLKNGAVEEMELGEDGKKRNSFVCAHAQTFVTITSGGGRQGEVLVQVPTGVRPISLLKDVIY